MTPHEFGIWLDENKQVFWYAKKSWNYTEATVGRNYEYYRPSSEYCPSKYPVNIRLSGPCLVEWCDE